MGADSDSLAMAEMTTLVAAVYKNYSTKIQVRQKGISPGITSRFEVFSDETFAEVGVRNADILKFDAQMCMLNLYRSTHAGSISKS